MTMSKRIGAPLTAAALVLALAAGNARAAKPPAVPAHQEIADQMAFLYWQTGRKGYQPRP